jgi:hypothetical protein
MQHGFLQRAEVERGTSVAAALACFDSLPAAPLEIMRGTWRGSGLPTSHPLDGMLEAFGWYGKRFAGPEHVHPLVLTSARGTLFCINPALIPLGLLVRYAPLFKHPRIAPIFRALVPVLRTSKPQARLRMTEYRGVVTATMIYDRLPIHDVFRMVDQHTLLGLMDLRGVSQPFFFILRRDVPRAEEGCDSSR